MCVCVGGGESCGWAVASGVPRGGAGLAVEGLSQLPCQCRPPTSGYHPSLILGFQRTRCSWLTMQSGRNTSCLSSASSLWATHTASPPLDGTWARYVSGCDPWLKEGVFGECSPGAKALVLQAAGDQDLSLWPAQQLYLFITVSGGHSGHLPGPPGPESEQTTGPSG